jgi:hypothetical protein
MDSVIIVAHNDNQWWSLDDFVLDTVQLAGLFKESAMMYVMAIWMLSI